MAKVNEYKIFEDLLGYSKCKNMKGLANFVQKRKNIRQLKLMYETSSKTRKLCKKSRLQQLAYLKDPNCNSLVKELYSEIFQDILRQGFKRPSYNKSAFLKYLVWGFQVTELLDRELMCEKSTIEQIITDEFSDVVQKRIACCQFWKVLKSIQENNKLFIIVEFIASNAAMLMNLEWHLETCWCLKKWKKPSESTGIYDSDVENNSTLINDSDVDNSDVENNKTFINDSDVVTDIDDSDIEYHINQEKEIEIELGQIDQELIDFQ